MSLALEKRKAGFVAVRHDFDVFAGQLLKFRQCHTVKKHVLDFAQHNAGQNQRVADVVAPFKRFNYVAATNKSGNGNRFAE